MLFPDRLFAGPDHAPTLEGQYVVKDITLVAAGVVLASTVKGAGWSGAPARRNPPLR